ncbi:hypothetical protein BH09BAC5_BH09BAC5_12110 [soil metagenome]
MFNFSYSASSKTGCSPRYYLLFLFSIASYFLNAQTLGTVSFLSSSQTTRNSDEPHLLNGNNILSPAFADSGCGLNYTQCTHRLGIRETLGGDSQPAAFTISGIPTCAIIEKAFVWSEVLGYGAIPVSIEITNPLNVSNFYQMSHIGTSADVCWNMGATHVYRSDVTNSITGNGTYFLSGFPTSPDTNSYDVEGATLFIIYKNPTANYSGTLVIDDGAITKRGNDTATYQLSGFQTCSSTSNANAFIIVGDMQMNSYNLTMNNGPNVPVNWNWWNYIATSTSLGPAQNTCNFSIYNHDDCFTLAATGIYYQTACSICGNPPITLNITTTNNSCHSNGTATVSATGGTSPYAFTWGTNPQQSGATADSLAPGTYFVYVTDALGVCSSASFTITSQFPLIHITTSPATCFAGGSASASVTGGNQPYSYLWNLNPNDTLTSISGFPAGIISLSVSDSLGGCADTTATISYSGPSLSFTTTTSYCNAPTGSATVAMNGGVAPFIYSWNTLPIQNTPTANALNIGTYSVTVTDSTGCQLTGSVNVPQVHYLVVTATVKSDTLCDSVPRGNGAIYLTGMTYGVGPYSYSWNNNQTNDTLLNLYPGNYVVTVVDSGTGCVRVLAWNISTVSAFNFNILSVQPNCNANGQLSVGPIFSGGSPPFTYSWSTSPIQTTFYASNLLAGTYSVTVTDSRGCSKTKSATLTGVSPMNVTASSSWLYYCDSGYIDSARIIVHVANGTPPYTYSWNTFPPQFNDTIYYHNPGIYQVTVTDNNGCMKTLSINVLGHQKFYVLPYAFPNGCTSNGDSLYVNVGAGGPFNFLWNTNPASTARAVHNVPFGNYSVTVTDTNGCSITDSVTLAEHNTISIFANTWDAHCDTIAGSAFAYVAGGILPYTFLWNTNPVETTQGLWGLSPGPYIVNVMDAGGCAITDTAFVLSQGYVSAYIVTTALACNDPSNAIAIPSGGSSPYSFLWNTSPQQTNDTAFNLLPGSYSCTIIDSAGCVSVQTVSITNAPFQLSVSGTQNITCGDSAMLTAISGDPNTSFIWNPGNLSGSSVHVSPGVSVTYTVTAIAPCGTLTDTIAVHVISSTLQSPSICGVSVDTALNRNKIFWTVDPQLVNGAYSIYKETPANSNTYLFLATQNISVGGTYIDLTSATQLFSDRYEITASDSCGYNSGFSNHHRTIYLSIANGPGNSWDLTWNAYEGIAPLSYRIYRGIAPGQLLFLASVSASTLNFNDANPPMGTIFYLIEAELPVDCSSIQVVNNTLNFASYSNVASTTLTSIQNKFPEIELGISPNPTNGVCKLEFQSLSIDDATIKIYNYCGAQVRTITVNTHKGENTFMLDLSTLSDGLYFVRVFADGKNGSSKIILSK